MGFVLTKYQCPSQTRYLLLLGIYVFGFTAKGIARSQIDDSTCYINYLFNNMAVNAALYGLERHLRERALSLRHV